jgi:hypothetical protein
MADNEMIEAVAKAIFFEMIRRSNWYSVRGRATWDNDTSDAAKERWRQTARVVTATAYSLQWRPIATAPHDGTPILIYMPDAAEPKIALVYWNKFYWYDYYNHSGDLMVENDDTTHWMPIPGPP